MSKFSMPTVLKNSGFNLFGSVLPILVGSITVPLIIRGLGTEGFGLLTLCWSLVGYFSIFDFGLTRALTVFISEKISANETEEAVGFFWTATTIIVFLSLFASLACLLFGYKFEELVLSDRTIFSGQLNLAFKYIAFGIPVVALHTAIKGTLEGFGRFFATNLLQSLLGISNFLLPVFFLHHQPALPIIVLTLISVRSVVLLIHFALLFHLEPKFLKFSLSRESMKVALNFGGWMTISNLVSPLMTYLDRFILSANVPVIQIAYYTTPFEIVTRLLIVPNSVVRALLPEMAKANQTLLRKAKQFNKGILLISFVQAIPVLILCFGAKIFFRLWLGPEFTNEASTVMSILAIGVWINSIALVPFSFLQTNARADLIAKVHVIEFPIFIGLLFLVVDKYGVIGAASIWTLRTLFECLCLFALTTRLFHQEQNKIIDNTRSEILQKPPRRGTLAIVITYNPPLTLIENLEQIKSQVDKILIVDNSTEPKSRHFVQEISQNLKIDLNQDGLNKGIGAALNIGFNYACSENFEYCVTFDHDTLIQSNYIKILTTIQRQLGLANQIGWLGGVFFDANTGAHQSNINPHKYVTEVTVAITSGALISTDIFEFAGPFREDLFIDYVDHEYCLRLKVLGYRVFLSSEAKMQHSFGEMAKENWGPFHFYSLNHNSIRRFYMARNRLLLAKEYLFFFPYLFWFDFKFFIKDLLKIFFFETQAREKLTACFRGSLAGFVGTVNEKN